MNSNEGLNLQNYIATDLEVKHDPTQPGATKFGAVVEVYCVSRCDERGSAVDEVHWRPGEDLQSKWEAVCGGRIPVFHNAAYDVAVLEEELGISVPNFECTFVMGYDLNPNMKLIQTHGEKPSKYGLSAWGVRLNLPKLKAPSFDEWSEEMVPYARRDAELGWKVFNYVAPKLYADEQAWWYYQNVDKPFIRAIMELNSTGLYVDQERLGEWVQELQPEIEKLKNKLAELTDDYYFPGTGRWLKTRKDRDDGYWEGSWKPDKGWYFIPYTDFNPNSHVHVRLAYESLYQANIENTESDYLRDNFSELPFTEVFTQYRKLTKLVGTYCKPFREKADDNGYVRGDWKQELITGRVSCVDPSLQVLPARDELGATFRKFIVSPDSDWVIVGIDLSNIELRVLTELQVRYFLRTYGYIPEDIQYAVDLFHNDPETPEGDYHGVMAKLWGIDRKSSKSVTFGRVYGSGLKKFCAQLKIPLHEGRKLRSAADKNNPSFSEFKQSVIDEFYEGGGLGHTMFGRRLVYPSFRLDKFSNEPQELPTGETVQPDEVNSYLARGERQAFNAKIQGTAADVIKMLTLQSMQHAWDAGGRLLAQVHDELLFLIPRDSVPTFIVPLVHTFNTKKVLGHVPIAGTPKVGESWLDVH